jgi:hypothetical protein
MRLKTLALCILAAAATASAAIDPVLLNLVMPDAKILSGINVAQSVASPFGQYVLSQMQPGDPGFQKFVLSTGVDPTRDVREVLAATNSDGTGSTASFLALARGTYVPAQILAAATANGGTITQYRGFSIIADPAADASTAIVFLDATTAVAGDLASVKGAIDRKLANATYTGTLAQKAQAASATNSAWFATVTPLSVFLGGKLGGTTLNQVGQSNLLQAVTQASGGVNFGSATITLTGDVVTDSPQNAQSLVDVIKFLVSLIPSSDPKVASLASLATFSVAGSTAHLSMTAPEKQVEQLFMPSATPASKIKKAAAIH